MTPNVQGDRWSPVKLLVDRDDATVAAEIAALDAQRRSDQVIVVATDVSCGVLDAYATPKPGGVAVELFFDERVQCVRAIETNVLFLIAAAGTNSYGTWNYQAVPPVTIVRTGLDGPSSLPTPVGQPTPGQSTPPAANGIAAAIVLTDPTAGDTADALAVLEAANSSGAVIVVANFQGCILSSARAIPMPSGVVVRAIFDPNINCFRAFDYQAFFEISSTGTNSHGAWNYVQQPPLTIEYSNES